MRRLGSSGAELLTTGEAAKLLGTSRQHVVDLCSSGRLGYQMAGVHRRIQRRDLEAIRRRGGALARDQQRSLWLHRAVAGKLALDPQHVLAKARRNLALLREVHATGSVRTDFDAWQRLLDGPVEVLLDLLASSAPRAIELRQNSPFAGVLTQKERAKALRAFHHSNRTA